MTNNKENNPYIYSKYYLSYWIFGWAIIYIVIDWGFNKQHLQPVVPIFVRPYIQLFLQHCNPTIALIIAIIVSIYLFIFLFYHIIIIPTPLVNVNLDGSSVGVSIKKIENIKERNKLNKLILFLYFTVVVIKSIPIYFLRNAPLKPISNIIAFIVLILIYYFYLDINGISMYEFYSKTTENSFNGNTPFVREILQLIK